MGEDLIRIRMKKSRRKITEERRVEGRGGTSEKEEGENRIRKSKEKNVLSLSLSPILILN